MIARTDGSVEGRGTGGPSNILVVGKETTKQSISAAVYDATRGKGLTGKAVCLCVGAAGSGNPEGRKMMLEVLQELKLSEKNVVVHDGAISLMGATAGKPGIVLVAGTGSVCFGVNKGGKLGRSSGWGYILGDEGSGYDIARRGMTAALRAYDMRGERTVLIEKFAAKLGLTTIEDLVRKVYAEGMERHQMSALAPLVLEAAQAGDRIASDIISYAGTELGLAAVAVARQLDMLDQEFEVAITGGILEHFGDYIMNPVRSTVLNHAPGAKFARARFEPVAGAIIIAAKEMDINVDEGFLARLAKGTSMSAR